jgi:hypothetical protein
MGKFDPQDFAPGLASKQSIEAKARSDNWYPYSRLFI